MKPIARSVENILVAAAGVLGLVLFLVFFPRVQPSAQLGLTVSRDQAFEIAEAQLEAAGVDMTPYTERSIRFSTENRNDAFYRSIGAPADARARLEAHAPGAFWVARFANPEAGDFYRVHVGPGGDVFYCTRQIPERESGAHLEQAEARQIARDALDGRMAVDWSAYREVDAQSMNMLARSEHSFTWETTEAVLGDAHLRLTATVSGDALASWRRSIDFPADFASTYASHQTTSRLAGILTLILSIALWIVALFIFAIRFKASEVSVRNGLLVTAVLLTLFAVYFIDVFSVFEETVEGLPGQSMTVLYINLGLQVFFTCLGFFFIWIAGESHMRDLWPAKLRTFDGLFARYFTFTDIGRSILRGYGLGLGQLGLWYAVLYGLTRLPALWPTVSATERQILSAASLSLAPWPPLAPFAYAAIGAMLATGYIFLFAMPLLTKLTRHYGLAAGITAAVSGALFFDLTVTHPHWGTAVAGIVVSSLALGFFFKYDLFAVWVGIFISQIVPYLAMLVAQPAGPLLSSGISGISVLVLALVFGLWVRLNGRTLRADQIEPVYVRHISERQRLKLELDIARKAQLQMLPQKLPQISGLDIAAFSEPARQVGGDYFDFFELGPDHLGFAVGDVSGKGMPAALYMTMLKGSLQSQANLETPPAATLSRINRTFYKSAEANTFVTLTYGVISIRESLLTFARAGHNPMIVYRPAGQIVFYLQPPGIGIGLEQGEVFDRVLKEERFTLQAGDTLILYTDGLTDGRNSREELFGNDRLTSLLKATRYTSAEELLDAIRAGYNAFVGRAEPYDDLTCMVIKVN
ncbi:MAG: PP2C family protein-serine/threonine phosphatase [Rhodothermales bacterium]